MNWAVFVLVVLLLCLGSVALVLEASDWHELRGLARRRLPREWR